MCPNHWTSLNKNIKIIINNHSLDMPSHALPQIGFTQQIGLLLITRISDCIIKKIIFLPIKSKIYLHDQAKLCKNT